MGTSQPVVALIHATPASIGPAHAAFAADFPTASLWNLLDDLLISQAEQAGGLTAGLHRRMQTLIRYAVDGGADAVLLTCSMYGPVAHELAATVAVPVLASDQALFDDVAARDAKRISVLGPVRAGADDTAARLRAHLGDGPRITAGVVEGARAATTAGDPEALDQVVATAVQAVPKDVDLIVLGQFSISPAQVAAQRAVSVPVLSPPQLAAQRLRRHFAEAGAAQ
ncbi:aspartate/glutamate racemase family protein [Actinoplanes sp. NPDC024001]|uniref:aspartate/glutamate racemase family protein n=1 Tax=Actinoplanes sp. NPDC024001 TaxID=3154598 RepID=UPI0033CC9AAA